LNIYSNIFNIESKIINKKFSEIGDIGELFININSHKIYEEISLISVFNILKKITQIKGNKSTLAKHDILKDLYKKVTPIGGKFLSRILVGDLRLGFSDRTILDVISIILSGDKNDRKSIESVYFKCSDLGKVAKIAIFHKYMLDSISIEPSIPLFAKLVDRPKNIDSIFKRFKDVYVQPKYDGMRCQIHIFDNKVKLFSRNLEDITDMYPDLVELLDKFPVENVIFDSEIIGFDFKSNKFLPFQSTAKRKRKYNIADTIKDIPISVYIFDLIYLNGQSFIDTKLKGRIEILSDLFRTVNLKNISVSETTLVSNVSNLEKIFKRYIEVGLEGVVVKNPDSPYTPGIRNADWLKIKRDSYTGVADTIDVVIMGYYYGKGVRTKFGIGAILVGIYNNKKNRFESICKIGTGFKDYDLINLRKSLDKIKTIKVPVTYFVNKNLYPDIWVEPKYVIVVRSDEITRSKVHTAGLDNNKYGYALRFPRFISFREDKGIYDATTLGEVEKLYSMQLNGDFKR
jgi:DNA ligase-1